MDVPGFALITGAVSGIGRACAKGFAAEGSAGVALLDMNLKDLQAVQSEVQAISPTCQAVVHQVNVTDEQQVDKIVDEVAQRFGRLEYVVNAAGVAMKHQENPGFLEVNLDGTFFVLRAAAKVMLKQEPIKSLIHGRELQRGSIVNFSSIQGVVGITLSASYTASKHAIIGLTRSASEDYADQGLRINAICPGDTETPLTTRNPDVLKAMQERVGTAVPMQRMGKPSFVTGSALMVDGGYCQR
ncbi:Short-chain dehydrogenase srdC [Fulvia fulva]|uniref:Short-chain dehydrogenase srdC n=1 Tax=Passalora fulva TaxID=5499 RepID=A0A9Q8LIY3_PASFU|nr:Short-chain dehydrogenase srdC [Fulvia fulva]KAK4624176.1 Short-chain dehydrogenase srdC [Fulvia fulva]KAK4625689.1 Short-chain dehydrogenase srdC [Fulvia fulva]UJO18352.1 Short-chain dehydrogenase srdC [Fulvia fulva]WPV15587.1 Short-chain dehydrogenase srdC [Fulvia fulva]WPV29878.1 Short-chain dehydrogenase srdC [Fulvia fulva]